MGRKCGFTCVPCLKAIYLHFARPSVRKQYVYRISR